MLKQALQWLILASLLMGCSDRPTPNRADKKQARIEQARQITSRTPQPRTWSFDGNQLVVVGVPTADEAGFVEVQNCYIWRDQEYRTSTISCPGIQDSVPIFTGGATADSINP